MVAALELQFAQKVPSHSVDSVELTLFTAERTGVRIVLEPVVLAVSTQRLLTLLAFNRVFEHVIANPTDELLQEGFHV